MSAQVEKPLSRYEIFAGVWMLAIFAPWALTPKNMPVDIAVMIDAVAVGLPLFLAISWVVFFGILRMTVGTVSKAWADGQRVSAAAKAPAIRLSPADVAYIDANVRRNAEIDAETWDSSKEQMFVAKFAAKIEEDTYMHASFDRRERLEKCTWTKDEEVAFNRRFAAHV